VTLKLRIGGLFVVVVLLTGMTATAQKPGSRNEKDSFKKWLDEDVVYIITKEELTAAKRLSTPEEQDSFIRTFWERRDPTPGTLANEYREEHYRRIEVANERFTTATDGWRTDRGKIYIRFGEPSNIDRNDSAGSTTMRSGENHMTVPFETWEYRNIPGIGYVKVTFVDRKMNGNYELTLNPSDKLARFGNEDLALVTADPNNLTTLTETPDSADWVNRVNQYIAVQRPPEIRFKELKAMVNVRLNYNVLPFTLRFDTLRGPGDKSIVPLTFEFDRAGLAFQDSPDGKRAQVNVYAVVTELSGRVAYEFEDTVSLHDQNFFQRFIALDAGRYKLSAVVKDTGSGNAGTREQVLVIPRRQQIFSSRPRLPKRC
jgi:GWxTD domain-containing protein